MKALPICFIQLKFFGYLYKVETFNLQLGSALIVSIYTPCQPLPI